MIESRAITLKRMIFASLIALAMPLAAHAGQDSDLNKLRALAEAGDHQAQLKLGVRHITGRGVARDFVQAVKWMKISAALGNKNAPSAWQFIQNQMTKQQIAESHQLIKKWLAKHRHKQKN